MKTGTFCRKCPLCSALLKSLTGAQSRTALRGSVALLAGEGWTCAGPCTPAPGAHTTGQGQLEQNQWLSPMYLPQSGSLG